MSRFIVLLVAALLAGCMGGSTGSTGSDTPDAVVSTAALPAAPLAPVEAEVASRAYAAMVVDARNGKVLHQNSARSLRYPASLTKMMTLYMVFEQLDAGRLRPTTQLSVSANAASRPPAKLGVREGTTISVDEAARAMAVRSANDVAVVIAENLAGSEEAFAARMTRKARSLGMTQTQFVNASGLPDPNQYTTARDMAILGEKLMEGFPRWSKYFQVRSFTYRGRKWTNTNKLLGKVQGVEGIKTGYIRASGYNLVTSVKRDGRHIIAVVIGGRTGRDRNAKMEALIEEYLPRASRPGLLGVKLF